MKRPANLASWLVLAFFVAAALWVFREGLRPGFLAFGHDTIAQFLPWRELAVDELRAGRYPGWNPYLFCGQPLAANPQVGLFYPPNALFLVLPAEVAFDVLGVFHLALGAFGAFHLGRAIGLDRSPAAVAGLVWGFGGQAAGHLLAGHATILAAFPWTPLVVAALVRWSAGASRRTLAGGALATAMVCLAGHLQFAYFSALVAGAYVLTRPGRDRRRLGRFAGGAAAIALLGAGLAAVGLAPAWVLLQQTGRAGGVERFDHDPSLPPEELLTLVVPDAFGHHDPFYLEAGHRPTDGRAPYRGRGLPWETGLYLGIVPLALLVALPFGRPDRTDLSLAVAAGLCLAIALGERGLGGPWLRRVLPGFEYLRSPGRFLYPGSLCLALLAGRSAQGLLGNRHDRMIRAALGGLLAIAGGCALWATLGDPVGSVARSAVVATAAAGIVIAGARAPWLGPALVLVVAADLVENAGHSVRIVERPNLEVASEVRRAEHDRFVVDVGLLAINHHAPARVRIAGGYDPLHPARVEDVVLASAGRRGVGVQTYLVPAAGPALVEVMAIADRGGPPRAYVVGRTRIVGDDEEALRRVTSPTFIARREVVLVGPGPALDNDAAGATVEFREDRAARVELLVETPARALLVLADTHDPEWEATVDGQPVDILRAQYAHRAVVVEPGRHAVVFTHRPRSARSGAIVTLVCLIAIGILAWPGRGERVEKAPVNAGSSEE